MKKEQKRTVLLDKFGSEKDKLVQDKDLKIKMLEHQLVDISPLQSEEVEGLRQSVIKGFWRTGSESHDIHVKCDRVELTGLLARKDYEQLLCTFLSALDSQEAQEEQK